jgi:hypothetical protein
MDKWFHHSDVIEQIERYYSKPDILLPVYLKIESVLEHEFYILLSVKSNIAKSCLKIPEFEEELKESDKAFTRETPRGREFLPRISHRFSIFPDAEQGLSNYYRKTTQEDIAIKKVTFSEGRHKLKLALRKEIINEDLKINQRKGIFCFDIFRYSEKSLDALNCDFKDEIKRGDYYIYKRFCRSNNVVKSRFRMKSVSSIYGKIII